MNAILKNVVISASLVVVILIGCVIYGDVSIQCLFFQHFAHIITVFGLLMIPASFCLVYTSGKAQIANCLIGVFILLFGLVWGCFGFFASCMVLGVLGIFLSSFAFENDNVKYTVIAWSFVFIVMGFALKDITVSVPLKVDPNYDNCSEAIWTVLIHRADSHNNTLNDVCVYVLGNKVDAKKIANKFIEIINKKDKESFAFNEIGIYTVPLNLAITSGDTTMAEFIKLTDGKELSSESLKSGGALHEQMLGEYMDYWKYIH